MSTVRFADVAEYYRYPPSPSSVYNGLDGSPRSTTEPEGAGSRTPSPTSYQTAAYQTAALSPTIRVTECLRFGFSTIHWDMRTDVQKCARLSRDNLLEPATEPPQEYLILVCSFLPWKLDITATSNEVFVTVGDVLGGIAHELDQIVTRREMDDASLPEAVYNSLLEAHTARTQGRSGEPVRRIDFLAGVNRCQWRGLAREDVIDPTQSPPPPHQFQFVVGKNRSS